MRELLLDSSGIPAQARVFTWGERERLYQHTSGARVLADWDGPGRMEVFTSPEDTWIETEQGASPVAHSVFEVGEYAVVYSAQAGPFHAIARSGAEAPEAGWEKSSTPLEGAGWVMSGVPGLVVDDKPVSLAAGVPLPYWRSCRAADKMSVVAGQPLTLLDRFLISDPDALKERRWTAQNMSDTFPLASRDFLGEMLEGIHAAHLNVARWEMELPFCCSALLIRKIYDQFHGRQRARVMVNGDFAAWWYEPAEDREQRWASSQVVFSSPHLASPGPITLSIDPPSGTALWDVSQYEIWGLPISPM